MSTEPATSSGQPHQSSSGSSSSSEDEADFVEYENRADWSDLTPIYLTEQETRLINIAYSPHFRSAYAYLRACMQRDERSERAFELTQDCIKLNPANYTVWYYRRILLEHLNKSVVNEISFLDSIIKDNQKNYQVWQHRKCLIERLGHAANELSFTKRMIEQDSKNYHAWQHRQWVVDKFGLFGDELEYVNQLLMEDVRNNSAWNHRYFVLERSNRLAASKESEIDFCLAKIRLAPDNESVWNYLRGLLPDKELSDRERVNNLIEQLISQENNKSRHLIGFQIDLLRDKYRKSGEPELKTRALEMVNQLIVKYDPLRREYWKFISAQLQNERPCLIP